MAAALLDPAHFRRCCSLPRAPRRPSPRPRPMTSPASRAASRRPARPGEVAIGTHAPASRFLQATRTGLVATGEVKVGEGFSCGTIVAAAVGRGRDRRHRRTTATASSPSCATPAERGASRCRSPRARAGSRRTSSARVSDRGDVVVAWLEMRMRPEPEIRVRVAPARARAGASGPPRCCTPATGTRSRSRSTPAIAATGEAVVTLDRRWTRRPRVPSAAALNVAIVGADGTVGAPIEVADLDALATPSLVGRRATAARCWPTSDDGYVTFVERAPGGGFGAPVKLAPRHRPGGRAPDRAPRTTAARRRSRGAATCSPGADGHAPRARRLPGAGHGRERDPLPKDFDPFWFSPAFAGSAAASRSSNRRLRIGRPHADRGRARAAGHDGADQRARRRVLRSRAWRRSRSRAPRQSARARAASSTSRCSRPAARARGRHARADLDRPASESTHFTLHLATEGATRPARRTRSARTRRRPRAPRARRRRRAAPARSPAAVRAPCARRSSVTPAATASSRSTAPARARCAIYPGLDADRGQGRRHRPRARHLRRAGQRRPADARRSRVARQAVARSRCRGSSACAPCVAATRSA